jgi:ABC-type glycerol-3-phosphate transport system substrate-binding protein
MSMNSDWEGGKLSRKIFLRRLRVVSVLLGISAGLAGCQSAFAPSATILPGVTPSPSATVFASESTPQTTNISSLTLWLPAAFRPDSNSSGGKILQDRIAAFEAMHPGVRITVRIRDSAGSGGMIDSLAAAAAAAPDALPDLIALDQSNLRSAAIKGLIYPLENLLPVNAWDDGYPYALSIIEIGTLRYGLPFAGDAMVLADTLPSGAVPETWEQTAARNNPFFLPLGDSRSLFLFFGYYAAGGIPFHSLAGAGILADPLEKELTWLAALQKNGVLSQRSLQIDSFDNAFLALQNYGEASATLYSLASSSKGFSIGYLPTPEGMQFSLATGWSWAIAATDPIRRAKAAGLMLWLSDPEFLAQWSQAQAVLPASQAALALWPASARRDFVAGISEQALAFPEDEISNSFGPVFSKAAREVLSNDTPPSMAAAEAAQVANP